MSICKLIVTYHDFFYCSDKNTRLYTHIDICRLSDVEKVDNYILCLLFILCRNS